MHDGTGPQRPSVPGDGWVEVDLPFPGVRQFEEEFAPNLATDGLFIPTRDPLPPSTVVRFHVTLPDDFVLLEGTGIVVWAREPGDPSGAPPGMSLRFATLSQHYQDLLDRIVQTHVERGGTPFEVEPRVGDAQTADGAESPSPASRGVPSERPRLTVRRAGVPHTMATDEEPERDAGTSVSDGAGPFDRTISLPPPGAAASSDRIGASIEVGSGTAPPPPTGGDAMPPAEVAGPPDAFWPPWEAEALPEGRDGVADGVEGMASDRADTAREDGDSGAVERFELDGVPDDVGSLRGDTPSGIPDELFSDDLDLDSRPPEHVEPAGGAPAVPPEEPLIEPESPRRRWSMGRTVATLAAAIVVVGVVAILVLSPWSRLVDSEADVSPSVEVTAEEPLAVASADGIEDRVPETSVADTVVATEPTGETAVPVATDEIAAARSDAPRPSQVIGPPASRIESITWEDVDGATRVTVRADGRLLPERVAVIPMASPPRVLIRIRHIETRYEAYVLEVGTPTVTAIRTGLHPELTPPALYVVCDLAGDGIRVLDSAFDGDVMTIILGS